MRINFQEEENQVSSRDLEIKIDKMNALIKRLEQNLEKYRGRLAKLEEKFDPATKIPAKRKVMA